MDELLRCEVDLSAAPSGVIVNPSWRDTIDLLHETLSQCHHPDVGLFMIPPPLRTLHLPISVLIACPVKPHAKVFRGSYDITHNTEAHRVTYNPEQDNEQQMQIVQY